MKRIITIAVILLLLQAGLVVMLTSQDKGYEPYVPNTVLITFEPAEVDKLSLQAKEDGELILKKSGDGWFVAGSPDVPAATERVEDFLQKLSRFQRGLAVATTEDGANRFKVSDENYTSRLVLMKGEEELGEIFFGSSAGFKQLHTRTGGSEEVVTTTLGTHEVSAKVGQWIDNDLLKVDVDTIHTISFSPITLVRDGENWKAHSEQVEGEKEVKEALELAEKIGGLKVIGIAATAGEDGERVKLTTELADDKKIDWQFSKEGENTYRVDRSDLPYGLTVSGWQVDEITKLKEEIEALFAAQPQEEEGQEDLEVSE